MSRRTKLILLSILLLLLAIPAWHLAGNWAPADPLRFRLLSRQILPDGEDEPYRSEQVEIEVLNTSTVPRYLENVQLRWRSDATHVPLAVYTYLVDAHHVRGPVIPAGGSWRGTSSLALPKPATSEPGSVQVSYHHASTIRQRVLTWYSSLCFRHLSESQQIRFHTPICGKSETTLEISP